MLTFFLRSLGKPWESQSQYILLSSCVWPNKYKIFPIRQENVEVDLAGVKTVADFEVLEILDEKDTYPTLLGI